MAQSITIVREQDGTFTVTVSESPDHQAAERAAGMTGDEDGPVRVQSVDEVLAMVRQELAEPEPDDREAWAAEAAERDETGYRRPGAGPSMSMGA